MIQRLLYRVLKGDLYRTIGRFLLVRRLYSWLQGRRQGRQPWRYRLRLRPRETSLVEGVEAHQYVAELRQEAVSFRLRLPPQLVKQIYQFAETADCREPGRDDLFRASDIKAGKVCQDIPVLRGLVQHPMACDGVEHLMRDPLLLQIARDYLGYWPNQVMANLVWSFVVPEMPEALRKERYNPLSYHYDVAGFNFMSAYFYLTPVDAQSGAHVMIRQSHGRKPWYAWMARRSGRQPDERLFQYYGRAQELVIEGAAGFGFVQDPSCFHKLLSPTKADRLLLHIRYA
ncbi:hypothetical protein XM38_007540 [Halomicronema hongdechloris C2206]|uniref:Uncharacterized protein n=1 Tax=Halomicronema hongdechloris C2206 TaxID=1641165 RepID=A0A1Z3HHQ4_9CYAN|nr:hypothetical protein [Halomicronema hongdechloris]ASC69824.1 hypothetical protein XM38_007540 [Halomicronema hongdechloris C2206]